MVVRRLTATLVAIAVAVLGASGVAEAAPAPPDPKMEPAPEDMEQARQLFENGEELYAEGSYVGAISAFRRAFALSGEPNCLYNIALAYGKMDEFEGAIEYVQYFRAYESDPDVEEIERMVADLRERQQQAEDEAEARAREEEQDDPPVVPSDPSDDQPRGRVFGPGAIAATSIAAVGLGVGVGLGIASLGRKDDAASACAADPDGDRFCRDGAMDSLRRNRNFALGADISFGVAGIAAVAAIVIIAVNARRNTQGRTAVLPQRGGALVSLRF